MESFSAFTLSISSYAGAFDFLKAEKTFACKVFCGPDQTFDILTGRVRYEKSCDNSTDDSVLINLTMMPDGNYSSDSKLETHDPTLFLKVGDDIGMNGGIPLPLNPKGSKEKYSSITYSKHGVKVECRIQKRGNMKWDMDKEVEVQTAKIAEETQAKALQKQIIEHNLKQKDESKKKDASAPAK